MAPKNKGKKGKNADDDAFWDKVGTSVAGNNLPPTGEGSDGEYGLSASRPSAFSSFATLGTGDGPEQIDEEEDFGGLMSTLRSTQKNKKGKEKGRKDKAEDEAVTQRLRRVSRSVLL
ncbi:hypothetical protein BJV74DRAFT_412277 [Russula compacta]|nr:hypothetical protein BJV74DRAFT_412277 [Russula compacta]